VRPDKAVHVAQNTGHPEWYTPAAYVEAARRVLGDIDLDPASSPAAQRTVKATRYFTAKDDGLVRRWQGRVFLNPPYNAGLVDQFVTKLCDHHAAGDVPAAVLLVNNATETEWFQRAAAAAAVCFPDGRIKFLDDAGNARGAPLQGQAIVYLGAAASEFLETFNAFGFCAVVKRG
jgi:hypothetical protein